MTEPRKFIVSTIFAWSLTISVGVMTVAGVVAAFLPPEMIDQPTLRVACVLSFAALAGLALGNANCAAAAAQHTVSQGAPFWTATAPALLNAAIFCAASVIGVHLGWEILKASAQPGIHLPDTAVVDVAAFLVAFAKVAQAWVVETRRSLDAASIALADAAAREEMAAIRAADKSAVRPPRQPFQPAVVEGGRTPSRAGQVATGVAVVTAGMTGAMADRPAEAATFALPSLEPVNHSEQTWPNREAHAAALLAQGRSQREAAKLTGLTRYKVGLIAGGQAA